MPSPFNVVGPGQKYPLFRRGSRKDEARDTARVVEEERSGPIGRSFAFPSPVYSGPMLLPVTMAERASHTRSLRWSRKASRRRRAGLNTRISPPAASSCIKKVSGRLSEPKASYSTRTRTPRARALSKAARKTLERKRLEAEHKRAQLEKMYQGHEISADAYNKGKEEYKAEIQKYREALKAGT